MREELVQKTGWQILSDLFRKGGDEKAATPAPATPELPKVLVQKPKVAYNPLMLFPGDLALLGTEDASEIRFVVDRLRVMRRQIGTAVILSVDYCLWDPTDDTIGAIVRALDEGHGNTSLLLLRRDGDNAYDERLEAMLNGTKPGSTEGFPNPVYEGFMRPAGAPAHHAAHVTEYVDGGATKSYDITYWDFVRDDSFGFPPLYLFEMSGEDGFFIAYAGMPLSQDLVRAFRY